jgi:hypothetical protein
MSALYAVLETSISRRSALASSRRFTSLSPSCTSRIAVGGLAGLKKRELAREIGCANGAVYNLVADMDELILRLGSRTLRRLDAILTEAESEGSVSAGETGFALRKPIVTSLRRISGCDGRCSNIGCNRARQFRIGPSMSRWRFSAISIGRSPRFFRSARRTS